MFGEWVNRDEPLGQDQGMVGVVSPDAGAQKHCAKLDVFIILSPCSSVMVVL